MIGDMLNDLAKAIRRWTEKKYLGWVGVCCLGCLPLNLWISRADAVGRTLLDPVLSALAKTWPCVWIVTVSYGANFFCWLPTEMDTCWLVVDTDIADRTIGFCITATAILMLMLEKGQLSGL